MFESDKSNSPETQSPGQSGLALAAALGLEAALALTRGTGGGARTDHLNDRKDTSFGAVDRIITSEYPNLFAIQVRAEQDNFPEKEAVRIQTEAKRHAAHIMSRTGTVEQKDLLELEKSFELCLRNHKYGIGAQRLVSEINKELSLLDWTGKTRLEASDFCYWKVTVCQQGKVVGTIFPVGNKK